MGEGKNGCWQRAALSASLISPKHYPNEFTVINAENSGRRDTLKTGYIAKSISDMRSGLASVRFNTQEQAFGLG